MQNLKDLEIVTIFNSNTNLLPSFHNKFLLLFYTLFQAQNFHQLEYLYYSKYHQNHQFRPSQNSNV
jgi:hypothetical protein